MKYRWVYVLEVVSLLLIIGIIFIPKHPDTSKADLALQKSQLNSFVRGFLESKDSPLAPETNLLLEQKHWKLLIAISAIESQYCKRKIAFNCWGIGGDSAYRKYKNIREAIVDANNLIERWQVRGRWLTVEDMNGHYVVPKNPNWVRVVNKVLIQLENE